jgi:hypothetical protein
MTELEVTLDFACRGCDGPVGATVRCAGDALGLRTIGAAAVAVPCPTCGTVNDVTFGPDGAVHSVAARRPARNSEPSRN